MQKKLLKNQYPFMIRTLSKLSIDGNFLNLIKFMDEKPLVNVILNHEGLNAFPLRSETRQ